MDELVAEKVMGQSSRPSSPDSYVAESWPTPYSTDIAAAWQVVERLCQYWVVMVHATSAGFIVTVKPLGSGPMNIIAARLSAPLAICEAALWAVGAQVPE